VTQPAQTTEASDSLLDESENSGVEVRHSYIRPKHSSPGSESVPPFLIRQSEEQFMLPRLLVWSTLGLLAYGTVEAGASTYHFLRDARVTPLAAAHIRAEVHALVAEVARKQPAPLPRITDSRAATVAFVPSTHVSQIKANAMLYDCRVLSMFACEPVGRVVELLPGEVQLPLEDTAETTLAGAPTRGQYAVMQLTDPAAADAKSLRVREALDSLLLESSQSPALDMDSEARLEQLL
jgi:hypothetical protein